MWLERLAGSAQSTPAGGTPNRSYSPLPRRTTQQGQLAIHRPGLTPRTSSLGALISSTDSLPTTARLPNGSNLSTQILPPSSEPLEVLSDILGAPVRDVTQDTLVEEIDFKGLSLTDFVAQEVVEPTTNFDDESERFEDLHNSIIQCDAILGEVEKYLASFRADLAAVSTEIETLQYRSTTLNAKLQNRKIVEKSLGPEVELLIIPPSTVRSLITGAIDEHWVKALEDFDKRVKNIDARQDDKTRAVQDLRPILDDISNKAVERIRDYIVNQIKGLRTPNINAQIIQQTHFIRFRSIFSFLSRHQPRLGEEIEQAYVNTMRWYFSSNFQRYRVAIDKLSIHIIEQSEVLAAEAPKRIIKTTHDAFSIGRRMEILRMPDTALSSYIAEESKETHYLEVAFRTYNLALIDNAAAEYSFLTDFFHQQAFTVTTKKFIEIWQPTLELGQTYTRHLVEQNHDAIGVLMCVRLNQKSAFEMQRRKVAAVEGYIFTINMILWPRFQMILSAHCESIRKLTASLPGRPTGSALTLTASSAAVNNTAPHSLTQRYATFTQAILSLSSDAGDDEPVANSLTRLGSDFEAFLIKLGKGIADARKRERFLYNNYSLVCTIIGDTEGRLAEELKSRFSELKDDLKIDS